MVHGVGFVATALVALSVSVSPAHAAAFDVATSLATKTPYWDQSKDPLGPSAFVTPLSPEEEAKYTLVQVQSVVRHGTRYPSKGNAGEIEQLLKKLQTKYADVIPAWLKSYKLPYNSSIDGPLAPHGAEEAKQFGARTRARIGSQLPAAFSPDKFIFQNTYKQRTKDTGVAFASAFFTNPSNVTFTEYKKDADPLLRFFDQCPRYTRDAEDSAEAKIQVTTYKASTAFQKNTELLRTALKLPNDADLTETDVESAYSACAFDIALSQDSTHWCTLLTPEFVQSCEFADDLDTFVESSAGVKISYEISAVLLQDIYKFMKNYTTQKTTVVGNFRFVHGETTTPLLTLLGYTDKAPLLASWTPSQIEARKFRASRIAEFMANIEFRLYTKKNTKPGQGGCPSGDEPQEPLQFYVQIRVNEQVTSVPGCGGKVFCPLSEVEKLWDYYLNVYDWVADCKI